MSRDARAKGTLVFDSADDLDAAFAELADLDEVRRAVEETSSRRGSELRLDVNAGFSNQGYLDYFEWLEDLVDRASDGYIDTWEEELGDSTFVRVHAGGEEEEIDGPFPS